MNEYSQVEIDEALEIIEAQLREGYLDLYEWYNEVELDVIKEAIKLFKEKESN